MAPPRPSAEAGIRDGAATAAQRAPALRRRKCRRERERIEFITGLLTYCLKGEREKWEREAYPKAL
jgi:hypothetical protein